MRIPPPLIVAVGIGLGFFLERLKPFQILALFDPLPMRIAGGALIALGASILLLTVRHFKLARTELKPWRPSASLIRKGPLRVSRNPIYLAFLLVQFGAGILTRNTWVLLFSIPVYLVLRFYVIAREERYLERAFGKAYLEYKTGVRRWL
ncbi:MAG: isoprenylcysteine carboxylmethyltransferase family protein [Nitrospirae bacterium]|nr:isoprenylcysteine carboxylmethyltransferase family protein [Nitrospirota bacterium]